MTLYDKTTNWRLFNMTFQDPHDACGLPVFQTHMKTWKYCIKFVSRRKRTPVLARWRPISQTHRFRPMLQPACHDSFTRVSFMPMTCDHFVVREHHPKIICVRNMQFKFQSWCLFNNILKVRWNKRENWREHQRTKTSQRHQMIRRDKNTERLWDIRSGHNTFKKWS